MGPRSLRPVFLALSLSLCTSIGSAQDPSPSPSPWDQVLSRINEVRKAAGLQAVEEDPKVSAGCQLHASYLVRNAGRSEVQGAGLHKEEKSLPGYSPEGAKSAAKSVVAWHTHRMDPVFDVNQWISTLYHRLPLLNAKLTKIGIGVARYTTGGIAVVVDTDSGVDLRVDARDPILFPVPDQKDVPVEYSLGVPEWPDPRPTGGRAGYPITATFYTWKPGNLTAKLLASGKEIPFRISTPEKPILEGFPHLGTVCILPNEILQPRTTYTVRIQCKQFGVEKTPEWSKEWSFTTAAQ